MDKITKENLDKIKSKVKKKNLDHVHVNEGTEGYGKSAFSLAMANYLDPEFDVEEQVAFSGDEFRRKAKQLGSFKSIVLDEAEGLFASDHMTKENKKTVKFLRKCREKNLFIFINWPVFQEIDQKIRKHRVKTLGRAVTQGRAFIYNKSKVQKIAENNLDPGSYPEKFMTAKWEDPEKSIPDVWSHYQELKMQQIEELEEEEEDEEKDVDWKTPSEFGELAGGASSETVRNWIDEERIEAYKRGNNFVIPASEVEKVLEKVN